MHIVANTIEFDIDGNIALLSALRQRGIAAKFSCRNGNCGLCEAHLNAGRVWLDDKQQIIEAPTSLLLCRAFARSDLDLRMNIATRTVSRYCRILSIEHAEDGYQIYLQLPAGRVPALYAGDGVGLEGNVSARTLTPIAVSADSSPRTLKLRLHDDDKDWLDAVRAGEGIHIRLPIAAS